MSDTTQAAAPGTTSGFKPKKSVALSGVTAGNTALCTGGKTGNDLHYRGYDILDIAGASEFEGLLKVDGALVTQSLSDVPEVARQNDADGYDSVFTF